jgi:hypothetical protein
MANEMIVRDRSASIVANRTVGIGGVWALFVDRWGPGKPVFWATLDAGLERGATFVLPAGEDHLSIDDSFAVRNIATAARRDTSTPGVPA